MIWVRVFFQRFQLTFSPCVCVSKRDVLFFIIFLKAFRPRPSVGQSPATWPYEEKAAVKKLSVQSVVFFSFFLPFSLKDKRRKNYRFIRILSDWNTEGQTHQTMGGDQRKKTRCKKYRSSRFVELYYTGWKNIKKTITTFYTLNGCQR
jgi:hypothetical protein